MKVLIREYLERVVDIDTDDSEEALERVADMTNSGEIELTAEDFTGRDIRIWDDKEERTF